MRREHTRALVPCVGLHGEVDLVGFDRYGGRDSVEIIRAYPGAQAAVWEGPRNKTLIAI